MKKLGITLGLGICFFSFTINAKPVSLATATQVGQQFLINKKVSNPHVELIKTYAHGNNVTLYIFKANNDKSFVIVAGDDAVKPILGYSLTNSFLGNQKLSPEVDYWLNNYSNQINFCTENKLEANRDVADMWSALIEANDNGNLAKPTNEVAQMMTTTWNQQPYYNKQCPTGTPTGCVATAMAQIMKYWETPAMGTGSHSYEENDYGTLSANFGNTTYRWNKMPDDLNSSSSTIQINAIATLMFHCGVAAEMDYSPEASGAQVIDFGWNYPSAQQALKNYFGYDASIQGLMRENYTNVAWHSLLIDEINASRPILYVGYGDVGGHAFVFDGYDDDERFHVNWGWGGMSDGFFEVDDLSPSALGTGGGGGNFNYDQQALIGIKPANNTSINDVDIFEKIKIYPVPAQHNLFINWTAFEDEVNQVTMVDVSGRTLISKNINPTEHKLELDLSNVSNGNYFLIIHTKNGMSQRKISVLK